MCKDTWKEQVWYVYEMKLVQKSEWRPRNIELVGHKKDTILSVMASFKECERIYYLSVENGLSVRKEEKWRTIQRFSSPDEK